METWAFCASCTRWFYVPTSEDIRLDHPCPACETIAEKVIQSGTQTAPPRTAVR